MSWAPIRDTTTTSAIKKSKGFAKVGALVLASDVVYHEDVVGTLFSTLLDL